MSNPLVRPGTISVRPGGAEESSAGPDWQEGGGAADLPSGSFGIRLCRHNDFAEFLFAQKVQGAPPVQPRTGMQEEQHLAPVVQSLIAVQDFQDFLEPR